MPPQAFALTVHVLEGRYFGTSPQALQVNAAFAGEAKTTPLIAGLAHNSPCSTALKWTLDKAAMRQITAGGVTHCKLTCARQDGTKLGWVMLDLRAAKGNALNKKVYQGEWIPLCAASASRTAEIPELKVWYTFEEELPQFNLPQSRENSRDHAQASVDTAHQSGNSPTRPSSPTGSSSANAKHPALQQPQLCTNPQTLQSNGTGMVTAAHNTLRMQDTLAGGSAMDPTGNPSIVQAFNSHTNITPSQDASGLNQVNSSTVGPANQQNSSQNVDASMRIPQPDCSRLNQQAQDEPASINHASQQQEQGISANPGSVQNKSFCAPAVQEGAHDTLVHTAAISQPVPSPSADTSQLDSDAAPIGVLRRFCFTLDLKSLQTSLRMPVGILQAYVVANLPADLTGLITTVGKAVARSSQLRTHPSVELSKGSECALPNGTLTLELTAGVMQLASLLARDPCLTLELWHKERFRADLLLGLASVPLSQLLQECFVEGYAPVYSLQTTRLPNGASAEEKIEVAQLRVVYSLEDLGPVAVPETTTAQQSIPQSTHAAPKGSLPLVNTPRQTSVQTAARPAINHIMPNHGMATPQRRLSTTLASSKPTLAASPQILSMAGLNSNPASFREMPEFEAAWELELWKKGEEVKFKEQLREKERKRMEILEGEWLRREKARETEINTLREEFTRLEDNAQQALRAVEERERKLLAAEESLARRRRDLERDHATRLSEAEAAVRRLQAECEHQLEMERDRNAELARQKRSLEERLITAEAGARCLEQAFATFREQHSSSNEANMQRELLDAKAQMQHATQAAAKARRVKKQYKKQVLKLAHELGVMYKEHQALQLAAYQQDMDRAAACNPMAGINSMALFGPQQQDLGQLKDQLKCLRSSVLAASATPSHLPKDSVPAGTTKNPQSGTRCSNKTSNKPMAQPHTNPQHHSHYQPDGLNSSSTLCEPGNTTHASDASQEPCSSSEDDSDPEQTDNSQASRAEDASSHQIPLPSHHLPTKQDDGSHVTGHDGLNYPNGNFPCGVGNHPSSRDGSQSSGCGETNSLGTTSGYGVTVAEQHSLQGARGVVGQVMARQATGEVGTGVEANHGLEGAGKVDGVLPVVNEVRRLLKEKTELLMTGAYEEGDSVIRQLDARIQELSSTMT